MTNFCAKFHAFNPKGNKVRLSCWTKMLHDSALYKFMIDIDIDIEQCIHCSVQFLSRVSIMLTEPYVFTLLAYCCNVNCWIKWINKCDHYQTRICIAYLYSKCLYRTIGTDLITFLSRVSILLLTCDIDIVILSVRLSVCLSVTRWYCMKTV